MQIKMTMKHQFTPTERPKSGTLTTPNDGEDVEQQELSFTDAGNATWSSLWKRVWQFLTKVNILLPHTPAVVLLGIYRKELKTYVHTKTCTWLFMAASFVISQTWKPEMSFSR